MKNDYLKTNKESWNKRTDVHVASDFYANESFINGRNSLKSIELDLLGDIKGKSILHLQCHFGQDTISLNKLGANVTGVDLSDKAIETAKDLAIKTNSDAKFICCDIYDLPNHLDEKFDIVYTSYGTIGWLPDMDKWAKTVSQFLKKNGKFVFVEFHPFVWMHDDNFERIKYSYFQSEPILETETTYADNEKQEKHESITWNHGIGEVTSSLIENNLEIKSLKEYDYSPYDIFNNSEEFEIGKFRLKSFGNKVPLVYSVVAINCVIV